MYNKQSILKRKRAQIWSFDLMVAFVLFVIGVIVIYFYAINYKSGALDELSELSFDANFASDLLLGEDELSIVTQGHINQTKLDLFATLSDSEIRTNYGILNNFYISFDGMMISGVPVSSVGIVNTSVVDNQIILQRVVVYQDKILVMEVTAWS